MRKLFFVYIALFLSANVFGQAPGKMSYQAVIRDGSNQLVSNQAIGMRVSVLQGSADGTEVYKEIYNPNPTTNANGLVSLEIGSGIPIIGIFSEIDWSTGLYFIKTETDPTGGTSYSITGVSQLMSVPYALYAETSGTPGTPGPQGEQGEPGQDGQSAYEIAVDNGFAGDETTWLNSLKGADGQDGQAPDGTTPGEMLYWNGTAWVNVAPGNNGSMLYMFNGIPTWISLGPGDVINPATGKVWMDRNLGAAQVATSSTDEDSYGDLYQWGRGTDGHEKRDSEITDVLSNSNTPGHGEFIVPTDDPYDWRTPQNNNLWQGVDGINNPCPNGYRVPTSAEWENERKSWITNNPDGALASPLKLPMAGYRFPKGGYLINIGFNGRYWSSSPAYNNTESSQLFFSSFDDDDGDIFSVERAAGASVRCIKD